MSKRIGVNTRWSVMIVEQELINHLATFNDHFFFREDDE